ncbi:MAG: hypothetical protein IJH20_06250 [Bacilli bacterium]|nr:hypothetical protein [Bacilli bacterium]
MKKVRLFLLLFIVLFLSGCSGVYELTINEDLSVLESATITLDSNSDSFDKVNNLIKLYDIPEEDYTIKESENSLRVSFSKKFSSFDEYVLNSKLYPNLVSNIYYTLVDKKLTIDAPAIFSTGIKNNDNIVNNYDIGLLKINIQTPLKVLNENSDESDSGIYAWNIKNGDSKKDIKIEISTEPYSNKYKYIIILGIISLITISFSVLAIIRFRKAKKI